MKAPVQYIKPEELFYGQQKDVAFDFLLNNLDWYQAEKVPRKEYYVHAKGLPYVYGTPPYQRQYESQPNHWVIKIIRDRLEGILQTELDVVFLNLYENQHHHLGWHADDSPEMSDDHPIVTVSLGAEREIWFRKNGSLEVEKLLLENGSAAVMLPGMQDTHQHRIPKHDRPCGPRISLTFRKYVYAS